MTVAVKRAVPPTQTSVDTGETVTAASGWTITVTSFEANIAGHPELGSRRRILYKVVPATVP